MDFNLSPESKMIAKAAQDFCKKEVLPIMDSIIEKDDYPDELLMRFAKARMLGMVVPKEYGGVGTSNLNIILILEELGKTGSVCAYPMMMNNSTAETILHWGSEDVKKRFLPPLCDGSAYASTAFTEPATGSDPTALTTTAVPDGDDFIVNGTKRYITSGNKKGFGVFYLKDEEIKDQKGNVTAFIVDKSSQGYTTSAPWQFMGLEGINCVDVFFKDVRVPRANILGERGNGFRILLRWIAGERIEQAAYMVGLGQAALDESIQYSKERLVRGKPMGFMQGIQWMLAEMKTKIDACRLLTYRAACLQDEGVHIDILSSELKIFVTPTVQDVTRMALQIHGSYGYSKEYKVERLFRYAAHAGVIASSSEINRSIAGSALLR
ncbi:MAG: acyl-CoA dehydrogenase family protein [Desulfobacteraceae bacterium]|nr:acyl-CoA dehydrogenase family protein [Desulfobacteraceae bacterium]MBL7171698.1 acyl-CoA dehydrogenase family protein [Desulfobacteraceae bacterium]